MGERDLPALGIGEPRYGRKGGLCAPDVAPADDAAARSPANAEAEVGGSAPRDRHDESRRESGEAREGAARNGDRHGPPSGGGDHGGGGGGGDRGGGGGGERRGRSGSRERKPRERSRERSRSRDKQRRERKRKP